MAKSPIVGVAYQARSVNLASQRCINLYLESMQTANGAEPTALYACPGLVSALLFPTSPVRAVASLNGVLYAVAGNTVYTLTSSLVATAQGTIGTSSGPAYIEFNDTQVGFCDSTGLWVFEIGGSGLTEVTLPFDGAVGVPASLDTLTVVSQPGTYNIWQCNPNDMTTWDPLNFTTEDGNAQPIVSLQALHDTIFVIKTGSYTPYVNEGNLGFVFGRLDGIYPRVGAYAAPTVKKIGENICWLGNSPEGIPTVYMLAGYEAREVSSYAIATQIQSYSTIADAFAFTYEQEGHPFYVLTFPTGGATWVLDPKETELIKSPVWHERAGFSAGNFIPYAGYCATQFNGQVYMGDRTSGNLYRLDLNNFQDNGQTRKWLRSWRAVGKPTAMQTEKCNYLDIQMDTGEQVPPDGNPQLVLRQSFDGGLNWSAERYISAGMSGETMQDVRFTRLGATKRGLNSDRTFELSSTDVFFASLIGAEIG
jgi:hypothetical protein